MIKHPQNRYERRLINERKEKQKGGVLRQRKAALKEQETEDELRQYEKGSSDDLR